MRTLLVLAKAPLPGRVKTRLARSIGDARACRLYCAFLRDVATACAALALGGTEIVWWVDGDIRCLQEQLPEPIRDRFRYEPQPEGDLGTRLDRAFTVAFAAGRGPVAAIGTDAPHLGVSALASLFAALPRSPGAALVPALDGGYAAIALGAPCPGVFQAIPWSTDSVLDRSLAALRESRIPVTLRPPVRDVDDLEDLAALGQVLARTPGIAPETAALLAVSEYSTLWAGVGTSRRELP